MNLCANLLQWRLHGIRVKHIKWCLVMFYKTQWNLRYVACTSICFLNVSCFLSFIHVTLSITYCENTRIQRFPLRVLFHTHRLQTVSWDSYVKIMFISKIIKFVVFSTCTVNPILCLVSNSFSKERSLYCRQQRSLFSWICVVGVVKGSYLICTLYGIPCGTCSGIPKYSPRFL